MFEQCSCVESFRIERKITMYTEKTLQQQPQMGSMRKPENLTSREGKYPFLLMAQEISFSSYGKGPFIGKEHYLGTF